VNAKPTFTLLESVPDTPAQRLQDACDAALELADKVAERVINHGVDPLAVALASNLHELVELTRRLRRERGV